MGGGFFFRPFAPWLNRPFIFASQYWVSLMLPKCLSDFFIIFGRSLRSACATALRPLVRESRSGDWPLPARGVRDCAAPPHARIAVGQLFENRFFVLTPGHWLRRSALGDFASVILRTRCRSRYQASPWVSLIPPCRLAIVQTSCPTQNQASSRPSSRPSSARRPPPPGKLPGATARRRPGDIDRHMPDAWTRRGLPTMCRAGCRAVCRVG